MISSSGTFIFGDNGGYPSDDRSSILIFTSIKVTQAFVDTTNQATEASAETSTISSNTTPTSTAAPMPVVTTSDDSVLITSTVSADSLVTSTAPANNPFVGPLTDLSSASMASATVHQQSIVDPIASTTTDSPVGSATTISTYHPEPKSATVTAVVATIVPIAVITACILLWIWWKNGKFVIKKTEDDIERHAVWLTGDKKPTDVASKQKIITEKLNINKGKFHKATEIPKRRSSLLISRPKPIRTVRIPTTTTAIEDPFLTPVSSTVPPQLFSDPNIRTSQIGLAVSTPEQTHHKNASTTSLGESIRTMIHHTTSLLSNPFRDPSPSSMDSLPQMSDSSSKGSLHPMVQNPTHTKPQNSDGETSMKAERNESKKSSSEQLALRWIEALKAEAAQAREAAQEAAKKAEELRRTG